MPTDPVRTVLVTLVLASLFPGSLAGCGGGGGSPGDPDSPVKLQSSMNGSLAVTVSGLPAGAGASVHVTGPDNYVADLAGSQTLGGIAPGKYVLTALPAVIGATTWLPAPAAQDVTVASGATASAGVSYAPSAVQPP